MVNFVFKMMDFVLKMMNYVVKMMDYVLKRIRKGQNSPKFRKKWV